MLKTAMLAATMLAAALFCSACTQTTGETTPVGASVTVEPVTYDAAEFKTVRDNRSVYDGSALVFDTYYEKITLENSFPQYTVINATIESDCKQFFTDHDALTESAQSEHKQSGRISVKTVSSQVTRNSGGIISIKLSQNESFGDDTLTRIYGMSFDLSTGRMLSLADALEMEPDAAAEYAREETKRYIREHVNEKWYATDITDAAIDEYTIEQFDFYIQNNNVCLCYPSGTLADSAVIVTCGK